MPFQCSILSELELEEWAHQVMSFLRVFTEISSALFGALLQTAKPVNVLYGYLIGAGCMIAAAFVELFFGVKAEQKSLEEIAAPLSSLSVEMSTIADKQS